MGLIFEVRDAEEDGYCAKALGHGIFTEAETWEERRTNVLEATSLHFEDAQAHPRLVQLRYVKTADPRSKPHEIGSRRIHCDSALTPTSQPRPYPTPDSSSPR
jgi:hypothetical protein